MSVFIDEGPYLVEDTSKMMREQRMDEQAGKRHIARVHAGEHPLDDLKSDNTSELSVENAPENDLPQHPDLDTQMYDGGRDPNLNLNAKNRPNAKMDIENEERENALEQQLKLGLMPGMGRDRTPRPGSAFGA